MPDFELEADSAFDGLLEPDLGIPEPPSLGDMDTPIEDFFPSDEQMDIAIGEPDPTDAEKSNEGESPSQGDTPVPGADKLPKNAGQDPLSGLDKGLKVLDQVLQLLKPKEASKDGAGSEDKAKNKPAGETPGNRPSPTPVLLDDIPVKVPTGGPPAPEPPAKKAPQKPLDKVQAALARLRESAGS